MQLKILFLEVPATLPCPRKLCFILRCLCLQLHIDSRNHKKHMLFKIKNTVNF